MGTACQQGGPCCEASPEEGAEPRRGQREHSRPRALQVQRFTDGLGQGGEPLGKKVKVLEVPACGSAGKESACNVGDLGSIPRLGRSPGERKGYPLQDSGLENSTDYIVHGVTKSQTWLNDFHFHF